MSSVSGHMSEKQLSLQPWQPVSPATSQHGLYPCLLSLIFLNRGGKENLNFSKSRSLRSRQLDQAWVSWQSPPQLDNYKALRSIKFLQPASLSHRRLTNGYRFGPTRLGMIIRPGPMYARVASHIRKITSDRRGKLLQRAWWTPGKAGKRPAIMCHSVTGYSIRLHVTLIKPL